MLIIGWIQSDIGHEFGVVVVGISGVEFGGEVQPFQMSGFGYGQYGLGGSAGQILGHGDGIGTESDAKLS